MNVLEEIKLGLVHLQGLTGLLGRRALAEAPLEPIEAAALADAMRAALSGLKGLLDEAIRERELDLAQGRLDLRAAAAGRPLYVVAGRDHNGEPAA